MIFNTVYIVASLLSLMFFVRRWNYINFLNPFVSFYVGYFFFVIFGGFYGDYLFTEINFDVKLDVLISLYVITIVGFTTTELFSRMFGFHGASVRKSNPIAIFEMLYSRSLVRTMVLFYVTGIILLLMIYVLAGYVPMLSADVHVQRIEILQGRGFLFHPAYYFIIISLTYFALLFSNKNKIPLRFILICMIAFLVLLGFGSRAHALLSLSFPLIAIALSRVNKLSMRKVASLILIMVVILFINGVLQFYRTFGYTSIDFIHLIQFSFGDMLHRFFVQLKNIEYMYLLLEPASLKHLTYYYDLMMLVPGPDISSSIVLKNEMGLEFDGGGVTPTIVGESFANFGRVGAQFMVAFITTILVLSYFIMLKIAMRINIKYLPLIISSQIVIGFNLYGVATSPLMAVLVNSVLPVIVVSLMMVVFNALFFQKRSY